MSAFQPLFGMSAYQPRHARTRLRWPVLALPATAAAIAVADTPAGIVVISVAAAVVAVVATIRWRWTLAAAKVEEIVAAELTTGANSADAGPPDR
ncbi:hypothetical protein [Amycolatopsis sp. CA-126428]|uniref:hypothetical protein n=1 Tax=Amycolatopsis sp. CA-126428 TaxID=2073158 RepID=UPI000CD14148|nr:hypothetical protein [Amycolatopsis sp. CA-126428]